MATVLSQKIPVLNRFEWTSITCMFIPIDDTTYKRERQCCDIYSKLKENVLNSISGDVDTQCNIPHGQSYRMDRY